MWAPAMFLDNFWLFLQHEAQFVIVYLLMELLHLDLPGWQVCEDRLGLCLPSSEQSSCCIWAAPLPPLVCAHHWRLVWGLCFIVHTSPSWTSLPGGVGSMAASNSICWERNSPQGLEHLDIKWESWDLKTSRSAVPNLTFSKQSCMQPWRQWYVTGTSPGGGATPGHPHREVRRRGRVVQSCWLWVEISHGSLVLTFCFEIISNLAELPAQYTVVNTLTHLTYHHLFLSLDIFFLFWIKMQMQFPVIP